MEPIEMALIRRRRSSVRWVRAPFIPSACSRRSNGMRFALMIWKTRTSAFARIEASAWSFVRQGIGKVGDHLIRNYPEARLSGMGGPFQQRPRVFRNATYERNGGPDGPSPHQAPPKATKNLVNTTPKVTLPKATQYSPPPFEGSLRSAFFLPHSSIQPSLAVNQAGISGTTVGQGTLSQPIQRFFSPRNLHRQLVSNMASGLLQKCS